MKENEIMKKRILAVSILAICVSVSLSNYSFGIGYYGTHHGGHRSSFGHHGGHGGHRSGFGHHGGHHSSFGYYGTHYRSSGRHGGHHSSGRYNHHSNGLHSSLYNHHSNGLYGQHYDYGSRRSYDRHNDYRQGPFYSADKNAENTYVYAYKEPYTFVHGKEYIPGSNAYVFQYEQEDKKESDVYAYNESN